MKRVKFLMTALFAVLFVCETFAADPVFPPNQIISGRTRRPRIQQRLATPTPQPTMEITKREFTEFGKTADGKAVDIYTLTNGTITVKVLNFGGVIWSLEVPDKDGNLTNVSANYEKVSDYEKIRPFFGSLVGRYGNRIAKGKFTLDGKEYSLPTNNGANSLHGGLKGFDQKIWDVKEVKRPNAIGLELSYTAADGEEGYPGKLATTVTYLLDDRNNWTMKYEATTDKTTVLNLTNHAYWNLAGCGETVLDHELVVNASRYLPTDDTLIPTGELRSVAGTFDFRKPHKIGERIAEIKEPCYHGGYDHCYVLDQKRPNALTFCAKLSDPKSGRTMEVWTTQPAVQVYTGNFLDGSTSAFGHKYTQHSAICLETQHYPDSPNQPKFPTTVLKPGQKYSQTTVHKFGN
jgi:aldose 1-epimerase